jgi:hypothetical protein
MAMITSALREKWAAIQGTDANRPKTYVCTSAQMLNTTARKMAYRLLFMR